jgi:pimeloyl-ACP methyl ester carboxylesterase
MMPGKRSIVILGGFLSPASIYTEISRTLAELSGQKTWVVNTHIYDWIASFIRPGWAHILNLLDSTVHRAVAESDNHKIVLIGHSQGGILARLYLSPEPFMGRSYAGLDHVQHLITLGSPHLNQGGVQRGGVMARWVQQRVPDTAFSPQVRYTCVAGRSVRGDLNGSSKERTAFKVYRQICGDGSAWGDFIVPEPAALLPGSEQISLDSVSHFSIFGEPWYGSEAALRLWWRA